MGWGQVWFGAGEAWYAGIAASAPSAVPALTPVSIGGHSYVAEASKYKRSTIPALRPSLDQAPEPGEVSLNNAGLWRRSQSDWRFGAMQLMFDQGDPEIEGGSKRSRYWQSKGLNPHPDTPANAFQLRMHKDVAQVKVSANANLRLEVCVPNIYLVDGAELYWTASFNGLSTVWTAAGMSAATGAAQILDVSFDGAYIYATVGASGVYRTANGSTVSTKFNAASHTFNQTAYANGNLFVMGNQFLYQMNSSGQVNGDTLANVGLLTVATGVAGITSLTVSPTQQSIATSTNVTLTSGIHTQTFVTTALVPAGSTVIPITLATPTFNFPVGTPVIAAEPAATGLLSYQHPNPAFVWQETLSTPHGIFVTGNSGIAGEMMRIDTDPSTGALIPPESMFILPNGEALNDMAYYSGAVIIGTSRGIRVAIVQVSFVISCTYGPVILIPGGVNAVFGYGEFAWFSWTNYDNLSTGLGRLDLARFALPETPAVSSDILAGTAASPVQGQVAAVANFAGIRCFAIASQGVWTEHPTNYVTTGTIDVGRILFGTTEKKLPIYVDLYHDPLPSGASIGVITTDEFGTISAGGVSRASGSIHPAPFLTLNDSEPAEQLDLQFTLTNGTDPTRPPVLRRWTLFALVTTHRVDQIVVPLQLFRTVKAPSGEGADLHYDTLVEWQYLKGLEAAGTPVVYKEGDNVEIVYVDQVEMDGVQWDPVDNHWLEGICSVSLITLGSGV